MIIKVCNIITWYLWWIGTPCLLMECHTADAAETNGMEREREREREREIQNGMRVSVQ